MFSCIGNWLAQKAKERYKERWLMGYREAALIHEEIKLYNSHSDEATQIRMLEIRCIRLKQELRKEFVYLFSYSARQHTEDAFEGIDDYIDMVKESQNKEIR